MWILIPVYTNIPDFMQSRDPLYMDIDYIGLRHVFIKLTFYEGFYKIDETYTLSQQLIMIEKPS